ncbi:Mitochondrial chaperone BCS1 [Fulvia fulva]|uniref:Mitochondrial chaperone BCS1 n=1 Tax=Passalora fulva TaxID=5499 RepID=A0A9Q8P7E5_PASFU|nr:Mitochondrial chaperone BCS1 [Fulvia fulva]KAK4626253.1 Mitochondrial chaperone BCS1 [Fulvia fulva]KAK4628680.1 Mitochondrial chaperone BCS1 [Fulvia fulva]UJO15931.1 Mitochondrial chaperone BCS1 [Fulvia fulva]WPV14127.1 Mitochondrial chaperone BCS1 [Fulvia fulva]WPV29233.1 Mitochondrial chaperone BCS1 [Fulvia fulva]
MAQPFHAGGATTILTTPHSFELLRTSVLTRLHELDFTHFGSIIAIAGVVPTAWRLLRHAWQEAATAVKRFFLASVTIPPGDPLNRSVSSWILENVIEPRHLRFQTARTEVGHDLDPASSLKKTPRSVQYFPHWQSAWFWHGGKLFGVSRSLDSFHSGIKDSTYDGIGGEELTISCLGLSADPIRRFTTLCRNIADSKAQFYVIIYSRDRYGLSWKAKYRKPLRRLETVHFDDSIKQALLSDIRTYLDPRTKKLYQSRSMPYRRGYLFYGPPGTGKSSLSTALAGEFGLDLYEVKIPSIASDGDLEQMFQEIPPRCIVLLEDIDAVWASREQRLEQRPIYDSASERSATPSISNVTLSGLLNVLDGVGSQEGRLVIMTTNKPDQLDSALTRPGRIDFKLYLGNISRRSAEQMFMRMFAPDLLSWARQSAEKADSLDEHVSVEQLRMLAARFSQEIPEDAFTPSQLQGFFQLHLNDIMQAVSSIASWVKQELAARSEKNFEIY